MEHDDEVPGFKRGFLAGKSISQASAGSASPCASERYRGPSKEEAELLRSPLLRAQSKDSISNSAPIFKQFVFANM